MNPYSQIQEQLTELQQRLSVRSDSSTARIAGPKRQPLRPSDLEIFRRLGIPDELLERAGVERVTDWDARKKYGIVGYGDMAGIVFPYFLPSKNGHRVTARLRRDHPEIEDGKPKRKYVSAFGDRRHLYFPPGAAGLIADSSTPIVLVEAEKSVLALMAWAERTSRKLLALGLGGCWGWKGRIGKVPNAHGNSVDEMGPVSDLDGCNGRRIYILLDANVATNPKVKHARDALVHELNKRNCEVLLCNLPLMDGVNGPDDFIAIQGDDAMALVINTAEARATKMSDADLTPQWPEPLKPEAFHGLAGEVVKGIEPHSEADPAAILAQLLVGFGNVIGRRPFYPVEEDVHFSTENLVLVGQTSKARKGVSWTQVRRPLEQADPTWEKRLMTGLSSGEGVVHSIRDASGEDPGEPDKRLMIVEPEFASVLAMMARQGNNLSAILRQAWDGGRLGNLTKKTSETCAEPHICVIGHVTVEELRRSLERTELANGFANRFLFICVRRSKQLPEGGHMPDQLRQDFGTRLKDTIQFARTVDRMNRDSEAIELWHQVYGPLSDGHAGLFGAVIGRAEAHVLRLSCLYALLDRKKVVNLDHLKAALALWKYAEDSARYIFGEATGDPVADEVLTALRNDPDGLTRTAISDLLSRNLTKSRIDKALASLQSQGLAHSGKRDVDGGRPAEIWSYGPTKKTN